MKTKFDSHEARGAEATHLGACIALVLALAGCGESPRRSPPTGEVRGEPIRQNPAEPAIPAASSASNLISQSPAPAVSVAATNEPAERKSDVAAVNVPATRSSPITTNAGGFQVLGFEKLASYPLEISDELLGPVTNNATEITAKTEALIPPSIKALNETRVELKGFMLPLKLEGGLVTEMLIMKDQSMCCFGVVPKLHEWVSVKMIGGGVKPIMDQAVRLSGTLHVGEMRENGYLVGLYRLDGEKLGDPLDD